jgi:hypothetical protein
MAAVGGWDGLMDTGGRASSRVRAALVTAVQRRIAVDKRIAVPPQDLDLDDLVQLGLPAYDSARTIALDLIRAGYRLARRREDVEAVVQAHRRLNTLTLTPADPTTVVVDALRKHAPKPPPDDDGGWDAVLAALAEDILDRLWSGLKATQAFPPAGAGGNGNGSAAPLWSGDALRAAWTYLLDALVEVSERPRRRRAADGGGGGRGRRAQRGRRDARVGASRHPRHPAQGHRGNAPRLRRADP